MPASVSSGLSSETAILGTDCKESPNGFLVCLWCGVDSSTGLDTVKAAAGATTPAAKDRQRMEAAAVARFRRSRGRQEDNDDDVMMVMMMIV